MSTHLSPHAQKAVAEAQGNVRVRRPNLARTSRLAIIKRPFVCNRHTFTQRMAHELPEFRFNSKRDYWEAGIEHLHTAYDHFEGRINLSEGARAWLAGDGV